MLTLTLTAALALAFANAQAANDWYGLVARGSAAQVEAALATGADPNAPDEHGWAPLAIAAARNPDPGVIHVLARAGAALTVEVPFFADALQPIHVAARSNPNPQVAQALVDVGADVNSATRGGTRALHLATTWRPYSLPVPELGQEIEVAARALEGTLLTLASPLPPDIRPETVIFHLPTIGFEIEVHVTEVDATATQLTLQRELPAPPDLESVRMMHPLPEPESEPLPTTDATRADVIETLVRAGANVNARDSNGISPLMRAATEPDGHITIRQLLAAGADARARTQAGSTALHFAAVNSEADARTVTVLLEAGLDVDARNSFGATPLMDAVMMGSPAMIEALLDAGANPRLPEGYTSLYGDNMMDLARQNKSLYRDGEVVHPIYWRLNDLQYD